MSQRHSISIRDRHGFERVVPINRTVTVGRQNQCDIVLPDSMVSRIHLRIEQEDGAWWVEDPGSSHGTYLKDERISRVGWMPGETLRIADGAYYLTLKDQPVITQTPELNLQAILQTAHLLAGEFELDELLEQALDRLLSISRTDRGFIMLPEGDDLTVKVQRNLSQEVEREIHLSMSSVKKVFEKGDPVWICNVPMDEKLLAQQSIMDLQLKTILCIPLMVQGNTIGVVYLDSRRIITEPVDRSTFEAIVSLCAIVIERTRLAEDGLRNQVLATVGQVASSIVHDFKNALFVIAGHAQMLGVMLAGPKEQHHVEEILGAVERLSQLSTDVLDYAKVREPKLEVVPLPGYVESLVGPHRNRVGDRIVIDLEGPTCHANLDKYRFARVIENLLANSLDAFGEAGKGQVKLKWWTTPGTFHLCVEDNGVGIPKKVMRRVFEPFYSHGKAKGTGLGMATVKKIVEEHGGELSIESEEGQGTAVTIALPNVRTKGPGEETTDRVKALGPEEL